VKGLAGLVVSLSILVTSGTALAQYFTIDSAKVGGGMVQLGFTGRGDSYYFLNAAFSAEGAWAPVVATLGTNSSQTLGYPVTGPNMFFRLEQLPLTSTSSILGDGIPDSWKLQHGLNVFGPSVAGQIPFGDTRTWLQIYQADYAASQLPLAYFPQTSLTNLVGGSNISVQVTFTKPFTGTLNYQLAGTAIPNTATPDLANGDYIQPANNTVSVTNATQASISIALVSRDAIEADKDILLALSTRAVTNYAMAPPYTSYLITTNNATNASICRVHLVQSTNGVYVGGVSFASGAFAGTQSARMAIRQLTIGGLKTFASIFDTTGSPILGNTFSVPVTLGTNGFQLNGGCYSRTLTNTAFGRRVDMNLCFGTTRLAANGSLITPVTLSISNLTASGRAYASHGNLVLARSR
jgi:hypothetical protein